MSEKIQILSNTNYSLVDVLKSELIESTQVKMAVAFVRRTGIDEIYKSLEYAMNVNNAKIELIAGLDFKTTDAKALLALKEIEYTNKNFSFYCFGDKRDNYNAQVLNVCGYNFSKYKTNTVKTYSKPNRNARGIQVFDKQGKQLAEFKTFGSFAQQYDLSEWDSSEYAKDKLTKRMKKFLTDHIIKNL